MRLNHTVFLLASILCIGLASCSNPAFQNQDPGWVLMRYATFEEKGVSGIEAVDLGEEIEVVQEVFDGSLDGMKAEILKSITTGDLSSPAGTYKGADFTWEYYILETQIPDLGPFDVTLMLGLSTDDVKSYFVALVTLPESYEEFEKRLYDKEWGHHFHNYFAVNEAVGVFVNEGLMNIRVFARDAGGTFSNMMMLYGEYMKERQQKGPNPRFYLETLLLYEKVQEFGKNNPEFNIPTP